MIKLKDGITKSRLTEIGIFSRNYLSSIILQIDKNGSKEGWLLRTPGSDNKLGSYSTNWNDDFTDKMKFEDLTSSEKKIVIELITSNFKPNDSRKVVQKLEIVLPEANIEVYGDIIDIDNHIIFDIKDVNIILYEGLDLKLILKDKSEYIIPYTQNIKKIILEKLKNNSKIMI